MAAIRQALAKLDDVVEKLEGSLDQLEESLAGQQRDMFAAPASNRSAAPKKNGNGHAAGTNGSAILAQRLDQAIAKVENILREG